MLVWLVVLVEFIKEREFRNGHLQNLHGRSLLSSYFINQMKIKMINFIKMHTFCKNYLISYKTQFCLFL